MKIRLKIMIIIAALCVVRGALLADEQSPASGAVTVTGEVLDMACYIDHGAHGEKHAVARRVVLRVDYRWGLRAATGKCI